MREIMAENACRAYEYTVLAQAKISERALVDSGTRNVYAMLKAIRIILIRVIMWKNMYEDEIRRIESYIKEIELKNIGVIENEVKKIYGHTKIMIEASGDIV